MKHPNILGYDRDARAVRESSLFTSPAAKHSGRAVPPPGRTGSA